MEKSASLMLLPLLFTSVAGCSPQGVAETISTAQVCSESSEILADMESLLVSVAANPLAFDTYLGKISELSSEFAALNPVATEVDAPHAAVSEGFAQLIETAENPTVTSIGELPNLIAETQIALMDFEAACSE
jgi:hypothetical protein